MQLRFTSFAVIYLRRDLHPQESAHAGRTQQKRAGKARPFLVKKQRNTKAVLTFVR
jgi:hypothetical protein